MKVRRSYLNPKIQAIEEQLKAQGYDAIPSEYYSTRTLQAGILQPKYEFFHLVLGDQDGNYTMTEEDTNMDRKTEFSYPFIAQYLSCRILPAHDVEAIVQEVDTSTSGYNISKTLVNDILKLYNRGVVKLTIQNKEVLKVSPLIRIPSGCGVSGNLAISSSNASSSKLYIGGLLLNGSSDISNKYPVEIFFSNGVKFGFSLEFPKGAPTIYNNLRVSFVLEGIVFRK